MSEGLHPLATHHLPPFITPPGETDVLMYIMIVFVVGVILLVGILYLRLHALPERMAHRTNKMQFEIVAVLALLALFTHNNIFWVAALLLAMVRIPDFSTPLATIAEAQQKIASRLTAMAEPGSKPFDGAPESKSLSGEPDEAQPIEVPSVDRNPHVAHHGPCRADTKE